MQTSIEFLGHIIDRQGIHPTDEKVKCIQQMKAPNDVNDLRAFLGLFNYYSKFVKNSAMILSPLYDLLQKDTPWIWSSKCEEAFQNCKNALTSDALLVHYNEKLDLRLACDASPSGLGAVLSHVVNGTERPIAYASRTLSKAERNYSQIEKEAASIIFGIKKFNQYLFGRKFLLITDHRPLISIFSPDKGVPQIAAARLQRWAILLSSYNYSIEYKKGTEHSNADGLSRNSVFDPEPLSSEIYKVSYCDDLPITSEDIAKATRTDKILGPVLKYVQNGWPMKVDPDFKPFFSRKYELSLDNGCILWGMRVVIPGRLRDRLLHMLHDTHPGISRMKAVSRCHFWWPQLDSQIEDLVRNCLVCQQCAHTPPATSLQPWTWAKSPWDRIHIDFAFKNNKNYLIVVDSHSKWLEVISMTDITSGHTIDALKKLFARYGLPLELVSDNGPQLISKEFELFLKCNGIKHILIPAYHPQSNGLAERNVQTFKNALKKMVSDPRDRRTVSDKISHFLQNYRSTPHCTTGQSPAELFLMRPIRTTLSLIHPSVKNRVEKRQDNQKYYHDRGHTTIRSFYPDQNVFVRSHKNQQWSRATIVQQQGRNTWIVQHNGKRYLAHSDQIRPNHSCTRELNSSLVSGHLDADRERYSASNLMPPENQSDVPAPQDGDSDLGSSPAAVAEQKSSAGDASETFPQAELGQPTEETIPTERSSSDFQQPRRNPARNRRMPDRLNYSVKGG